MEHRKDRFEDTLKERLYNYEAEPNPISWEILEEFNRINKKQKRRKIFWFSFLLATMLSAGSIGYVYENTLDINQSELAIADQNVVLNTAENKRYTSKEENTTLDNNSSLKIETAFYNKVNTLKKRQTDKSTDLNTFNNADFALSTNLSGMEVNVITHRGTSLNATSLIKSKVKNESLEKSTHSLNNINQKGNISDRETEKNKRPKDIGKDNNKKLFLASSDRYDFTENLKNDNKPFQSEKGNSNLESEKSSAKKSLNGELNKTKIIKKERNEIYYSNTGAVNNNFSSSNVDGKILKIESKITQPTPSPKENIHLTKQETSNAENFQEQDLQNENKEELDPNKTEKTIAVYSESSYHKNTKVSKNPSLEENKKKQSSDKKLNVLTDTNSTHSENEAAGKIIQREDNEQKSEEIVLKEDKIPSPKEVKELNEVEKEEISIKNKKSIFITASPDFTFPNLNQVNSGLSNRVNKPTTGVSGTVGIDIPIRINMSLRSGLGFHHIKSNYDILTSKYTHAHDTVSQQNVYTVVSGYDVNGQPIYTTDTTYTYTIKDTISQQQYSENVNSKINLITIPLSVNYQIPANKRITYNLSLGINTHIFVNNSTSKRENASFYVNQQSNLFTKGRIFNTMSFSVQASAGFQYKLTDKLQAVVSPKYTHFVSALQKQNESYRQRPISAGIDIGLIYKY